MHTAAENVHTEATHLAPQTVRRQLLEQHIELRRLLALGVVQALGVVDHRCAASGALARDLLRDMAREERALLTGDGRSQGPG